MTATRLSTPDPGQQRPVRQLDARTGADEVVRFDRVERWLHWTNALLVTLLIGTGSLMYVGLLAGLFAGRELIERVHLLAGLALPVPFVASIAGPWGRGLRRDVRRLGRFRPGERRWFRRRSRAGVRVGKFNPGQKVNAVLVAAALPVMFATGVLLEWNDPLSDSLRTGTTFVHDWGYLALTALVIGHVRKALRDRTSLGAMARGRVPMSWARDHHPRWHAEVSGVEDRVVPPAPYDDRRSDNA